MNSDEITISNMFLGLFIRVAEWPCPFEQMDFSLRGVQKPIFVVIDHKTREVKPEAILISDSSRHCMALEIKSKRVSSGQLRRYLALKAEDVRRACGDPIHSDERLDVVMVTENENVEDLAKFIRRHLQKQGIDDLPFPLLVRDESSLRLHDGAFALEALTDTFTEGISGLDVSAAPRHFIRFTADSPTCVLLPDILNAVHGNIVRSSEFTVRDICHAIAGSWEHRGEQDKNALAKKVQYVLHTITQGDYSAFIQLNNINTTDSTLNSWKPYGKKLTAKRMDLLGRSRDLVLQKYSEADNDAFMSSQPPLI